VLGLDNELVRDYLQLVLLTGLRRNEALGLKWQDIDLAGGTLTVRGTKNGTDHTLPLPDYLAGLLGRMPRHGAHVFEGPRGRLRNPTASMREVTRRSGVKFTSHDLRRSFATVADSLDIPGYSVKALLNHKGTDVTSGYIIASTDRLRTPMQKIEAYMLQCAGVEPSAEGLPFERADRR
jgi:integrase